MSKLQVQHCLCRNRKAGDIVQFSIRKYTFFLLNKEKKKKKNWPRRSVAINACSTFQINLLVDWKYLKVHMSTNNIFLNRTGLQHDIYDDNLFIHELIPSEIIQWNYRSVLGNIPGHQTSAGQLSFSPFVLAVSLPQPAAMAGSPSGMVTMETRHAPPSGYVFVRICLARLSKETHTSSSRVHGGKKSEVFLSLRVCVCVWVLYSRVCEIPVLCV